MTEQISGAQARRIALNAQGLGPRGSNGRVGAPHLRKVIDRTKLLQIDSVNVLVRSHYMPVFSRLGPYSMNLVDDAAYKRRELTEYWGRQASYIPMDMWPLFEARMERPHPAWLSFAEANAAYLDWVIEQLRERGPLPAGALDEGKRDRRGGHWWNRTLAKSSLEYLFVRGRVAVASRRNFERQYDLTERVVPKEILAKHVEPEDAQRQLIAGSAHAIGLGTVKDIAGYFGQRVKDAHLRLKELADAGKVVPVRVEGWKQPAYMYKQAKAKPMDGTAALLTPFDTLIWERNRIERLFGFYYRIEIYVPAPKRIHGYYVLPFLMDDAFVARVDLKADRQTSALLVQGAFAEPGRDKKLVAARLGAELRSMADWLGLENVVVKRNGDLAPTLAKEVGNRR